MSEADYYVRMRLLESELKAERNALATVRSERDALLAARLTKARIEEAAASLFISDTGLEANQLILCRKTVKDRHTSYIEFDYRTLPDVVALLCHHLGVSE